MDEIKKHLELIDNLANRASELLKGEQKSLTVRFVFCAFDKLYKVNSTIKVLYPLLNANNSIEFSLGILLRAVLMDCISIQYLSLVIQKNKKKTIKELREKIENICLNFVSDGAHFLLNDILKSKQLEESKKEEITNNFLRMFPNIYLDKPKNLYKKKDNKEFGPSKLYQKSKDEPFLSLEMAKIFDLYSGYSKYDHLSHLTPLMSNQMDYDLRLSRIKKSIALIIPNLRSLLIIAYEFGDKKLLIGCIEEINAYMNNPHSA